MDTAPAELRHMKSITFTGSDKLDLDAQISNWRLANSHISVREVHGIKYMPQRRHFSNALAVSCNSQPRVLVRVDYD
jgi:hypothetical protein